MTEIGWLALYSGLIMLVSLLGGCLPLLSRISHGRLQIYLSASAGVMLGAAFFHVMPDAIEYAGVKAFGWWMALGVVGLFCIERFIAPHSHEVDGNGHGHHHHDHDHAKHHDHHHAHAEGGKDSRAAAPAVAGWMAVLGLTIHTFMNGFGLAGAVRAGMGSGQALATLLPGLALFLAILVHKPADALAITTVLSRKGVSHRRLSLVQFCFAAMIPIGAAVFVVCTRNNVAAELRNQLTGAALAFSAGTFLFIALSDLLPEVQFHRHDRLRLFATLVAGVALMGGIAYLEPHDDAEPAATHVVQR